MKTLIAVFLICFWLAFPVLLIFMGYSNINTLDIDKFQSRETLNFFDLVSVYFNLMFMNIPNISPFFTFFIWILQALSALFVILLLRS